MKKLVGKLFSAVASVMMLACMIGCAKQAETKADITGIIGAMDEEVQLLKDKMKNPSIKKKAGMEFCEGTIDGNRVVVVKCGMGKVNAGVCAEILIDSYGVGRIINTGVAGSLDADIDIGDIVVSTEAVQHDFDLTPIGYEPGEMSDYEIVAFPADDQMREQAVAAVKEAAPEVGVFEGRVCTGDQFIATREQKDAIIEKMGGLCCEMEGGAIAQVCFLNKTPFVIIRAISDKADDSEEMSYEVFKEDAAVRCANITYYMLTHRETEPH